MACECAAVERKNIACQPSLPQIRYHGMDTKALLKRIQRLITLDSKMLTDIEREENEKLRRILKIGKGKQG